MSTLADERKDYSHATLDFADLGDDPIFALARWIDEARARAASEPTAMTLCTVDPDGTPSARIVLCKGVSADGLSFYTNYESRKGRALAQEPRAAATFFWPALERQARIEGITERVSRSDSEQYFHSRPRGSQIAAGAWQQSAALPDRALLEAEVARLEAAFPNEVPLPESWGGYLLRPRAIEFWQGRPSRLHDRISYVLVDGNWTRRRLAP